MGGMARSTDKALFGRWFVAQRCCRCYGEISPFLDQVRDTRVPDYRLTSESEKQLKHRFQKWGVRKYIRDRDMAIMLSFHEQYRQAGYQVKFHYRGHEVEQERINRASRRRKRVLPPTTGRH